MLAAITPRRANAAVMSAGSLCTITTTKQPTIMSASSTKRAASRSSGGIELSDLD